MKSCIKTLYSLEAKDIVHNVTFMAGATNFNENKHNFWKKVFTETVSGKVKNVYSSGDWVLHLY